MPPLSTGRSCLSAARTMVGQSSLPESSGLMSKVSCKGYNPPFIMMWMPSPKSFCRRLYSRACRMAACKVFLGEAWLPSFLSFPSGLTQISHELSCAFKSAVAGQTKARANKSNLQFLIIFFRIDYHYKIKQVGKQGAGHIGHEVHFVHAAIRGEALQVFDKTSVDAGNEQDGPK